MDFDFGPFIAEVIKRLESLDGRLSALESSQPKPLEFPPIDLGLIPGTGPEHPFEDFSYTERS